MFLEDSTSKLRPLWKSLSEETKESPATQPALRPCYRVKLEKGQDGWIVARCLNLQGAISQGKDRDEALRNIVEAIAAILEDALGDQAQEFSVVWEER
jgi:predicted RNase H-like HicB family nuclease